MLINNLLEDTPYQSQIFTSRLMDRCRLVFPFLKGQVENFYIENRVLYMKLYSSLLTKELRLNKNKLILRIQEVAKSLNKEADTGYVVSDVFFL